MTDDEEEYVYSDEEEEEDYVYSDEDEVTKVAEDDSIFQIPDSGYKIVDYQDILPMMVHLIDEVSSLLDISPDISQVLLHQFRWNKERLVESFFQNSNKAMKDAGLASDHTVVNMDNHEFPANFCRICRDQCSSLSSFGLSCNHKFCTNCYRSYIASVISDGPSCVAITCPEHQCYQRILAGVIESLFSSTSSSSSSCSENMYDKFVMYMTRNFIETSASMRWCPSPGCEQVVIGSGVTAVKCNCGACFCFKCGRPAHDPATCRHLEQWEEKCSSESETANWILANTKKCPKCSARIEKNQGCNHMTCKVCKHDFCWICLGPWSEHGQNTGGYYKCNKYDAKPANSDTNSAVAKAKAELDRYLHYYQRFHGHDMSLKFAAKQRANAEKRMTEMQASEKSAWIDVQFLKQAVEQVIECRRILKYTYVLGHYLQDHTGEKELYEHHQEMLEKHTEQLSELTEKETFQDATDRTHIVNLTRITERFVNSMLSVMMEG